MKLPFTRKPTASSEATAARKRAEVALERTRAEMAEVKHLAEELRAMRAQ